MSATLLSRVTALVLLLIWPFPGSGPAHARQAGSALTVSSPESAGMNPERLGSIDRAVMESIDAGELPGAVVLVGRMERVVYRKAFGNRALEPRREAMTADTIFDLASVTKVVATATSIMKLVEEGLVSLQDPVARYIPEFGRHGKERVTVEQLLTHRAGFVPDNELEDYVGRTVDRLEQIYALRPIYEPGAGFLYSDVGFIVAGEIIRRVSGRTLDEFSVERIFRPLGMRDTFWGRGNGDSRGSIATDRLARIAPTEEREGRWMRGEVHDPRAYELGGVAGHAGLFSTADDLARFCRMILGDGRLADARILAPSSIERMVSAHSLPTAEMRGIGWDVNTSFSSNRGDLFPVGGFGHTGFTGTSIWVDPSSRTFVVFLSNRVHPSGRGDVTRLRSLIASIVAASVVAPPFTRSTGTPGHSDAPDRPRAPITRSVPTGSLNPVLTGIDVLVRDDFEQLKGRRIGLITNHTGRNRNGELTVNLLARAPGVELVAVFSPEHGISGIEDGLVPDSRVPGAGVPVFSLYAEGRRRPTPDQLAGIDTLVYDVQDVGTRFYTYITTCAYAMEEAAKHGIRFVVLDRPNPINGYEIEGPVADSELTRDPAYSFTAYHDIPVRYGMTIGELAWLLNEERGIGADLTIIQMVGWRRANYFDGTALPWINPSPNMRSLTQAVLYPGIGLLETTNLSVGRGTDRPFEVVGAPWIDGQRLSSALNRSGLAGVRFVPIRFKPTSSIFAGEECEGIGIMVTDRNAFRSIKTGLEIAYQIHGLHPGEWEIESYLRLLANRSVHEALKAGKSPAAIEALWRPGLADFARTRKKYLIY